MICVTSNFLSEIKPGQVGKYSCINRSYMYLILILSSDDSGGHNYN